MKQVLSSLRVNVTKIRFKLNLRIYFIYQTKWLLKCHYERNVIVVLCY